MTAQERIEKVETAKEMVQEAQLLVREAIADTPSVSHYEAYGEYGFNQLLNNGNPYDSGLENLIKELEDYYDGEEGDRS